MQCEMIKIFKYVLEIITILGFRYSFGAAFENNNFHDKKPIN